MTTLLSYKTTLAYLAYLGYPYEDTTTALNVILPRKRESVRFGGSGPQRNVFLCYVLGAAGSGKVSTLPEILLDLKIIVYMIRNIDGVDERFYWKKVSGDVCSYSERVCCCKFFGSPGCRESGGRMVL